MMTHTHSGARRAEDSQTDTYTLFQTRILEWFEHHGRKSLPWQRVGDPYLIWVAEIMLQQTRVETVIPYYQKFIARFPNIESLAHADLDELLYYWAGLGYYARARNLLAAAEKIAVQYAGEFPTSFEKVFALPGIGRSTAGAILAFAWGMRHPILDGNVKRVLTRYYAISGYPGGSKVQARLWEVADRLTPAVRVGDYTQAMMDLGATVCVRTKPLCESCPLAADCIAFRQGNQTSFPEAKPHARPRPRKSTIMLVVKNHRDELLMIKRPPSGIWGGLWSLPEYPEVKSLTKIDKRAIEAWFSQQYGLVIKTGQSLPTLQHSFSHFDYDILPLLATYVSTSPQIMDVDSYSWYSQPSSTPIGLPVAVTRILNTLSNI